MKIKLLFWKILFSVLVVMTGSDVKAIVPITDNFSLGGYVRYEIGLHTGQKNPALTGENNDLTLSRFFLQTEWTYKPSKVFKLFANIRLQGDTTYLWDNELHTYNAFPIDVPKYDWMMMKASEDAFRAEVWELYSDITLGDLWLRLGKQQIAWGEMIGGRILDTINPLDLSWNFLFEPEEFELIRIPNWSLRGIYSLNKLVPDWLQTPSLEAFLTPGDILPNQYASPGAPFFLFNFPPFLRIHEKSNRGKLEYGVRVGGMAGGFYGTLNYMHLYSDDFNLKFKGLTPDFINGVPLLAPFGDFTPYAMLLNAEYKSMDLYGLSCNYAFAEPWNLVVTFEGLWIPNQPYGDARSMTPAIKDQGTWKYAIRFDRSTSLVPPQFLAASYAMIQLQFLQTVVEGDPDRILGSGNGKVDKTVENIAFVIQQPLFHNNFTVGFQMVYDIDNAYFVKPSFKYVYGDHWYFDLFAIMLGGSEKRPGRFGSLSWADSVYGRITFQF